jgi:hypothetical protein
VFDFQTVKLMHVHGEEQFPMHERAHHDSADHDPERGWAKGTKIYRCSRCDEEIIVVPPGHEAPDA